MSTCLSLCALNLIELSSFCNFGKGAKFESRKENKSGRRSVKKFSIAILRPTGGPSCLGSIREKSRLSHDDYSRLFLNVFTHLDTNDYNIKNTF